MKLFAKNRASAIGKVLPLSEFRLMRDSGTFSWCDEKMKTVTDAAEGLLDKPLKVIPLSAYRKYQEEGSVNAFGAPFAGRLDDLIRLGLAEAYEGKGRFTEKLVDYIWAMLEESTWVLPEHTGNFPARKWSKVPPVVGDKYRTGIELGGLYRAATMALIYHLNKKAITDFSETVAKRIEYTLRERAIDPYLNNTLYWAGDLGGRVNNWCPWNVASVLLVTALIEDENRIRERVVEKALVHLDNFISCYPPDGGCEEGPTYWGAASGALFDALELIYDMTGGEIDLFRDPQLVAMGEYLPRFCISGVRFVNFADASPKAHHDPCLLYRFGKRCGSEILVAFAYEMAKTGQTEINRSFPYRTLRNLTTPIMDTESSTPTAATDSYFPDLKVMLLRESSDPRAGTFMAIKGGHNGEMHNHNDVGSFVVYRGGEPVLIDVGVGGYTKQTFSADRYKIWSMQSLYHNLPAFSGVGEMQGSSYRSNDEQYDPVDRSLTLSLEGAYPEAAGLVKYERYATLKGSDVTLRDKIVLREEGEISLHFMTHKRPEERNGALTLAEGMTMYYDPRLTATVEEVDPVGMNTKATFGTEKLYRIRLTVRARDIELCTEIKA